MKRALLVVLVGFAGCRAGPRGPKHRAEARHSVGAIPCRAAEIDVSNTNYGTSEWRSGLWVWDARCRGQTYLCSMHMETKGPGRTILGPTQGWTEAKCTPQSGD